MRRKLNSSGSLIRIEELPSGGQDKVDWGQEGTGRGKKKYPILHGECSSAIIKTTSSLIFSSLEKYQEALVSSIKKASHPGDCLPHSWSDSTAVCVRKSYKSIIKMSIIELKNLPNNDLKKRLASQIDRGLDG